MSRSGSHDPTSHEHPRPGGHRPEAGMTGARPEGAGGVVETVREKASDLAGQVRDMARDWASSATEKAGQAWDATRRQARDLASGVASSAEDAWDGLNSFIRRYPVVCVGAALGIGLLLGGALAAGARRSWRD
jgi:ElaB/YqjD/DUF883 family membrane-anchored ribosome-binding protein